ncbi:hypothetical protein ACFE04_008569 [Oxalis oulophora]
MAKISNTLLVLYAILYFFGGLIAAAEPVEEKQYLLNFINNIHRTRPINWSNDSDMCSNWTGVTCDADHSKVVALRLPGMGFHGAIPPGTLSRLSGIQILSLRSNNINGSFPLDFVNLRNLTVLYLQSNKFSGLLPADFSSWKELSVQLDLSNNNLTGKIPLSLQRFSSRSFAGNNYLSAENALPPALPVQPPAALPKKSTKKTKLSESALLGIVIGGCVLGFVLIAVFMILCYSRKRGGDGLPVKSQKKKKEMSLKSISENKEKDSSLAFFEGCSLAFDLEDLLRASAEVLGKGVFGTTYRAALEDATTVVVKRLKEVVVPKREFEQHMEIVGGMRHENVTPLRAFYYSKDEKLMVYDYYNQGSVFAMLHGKKGEGKISLDWETRLGIAIGTARGIAYIHTQNGGKLVHGNVKALNIFLNSQGYGCVSDIGLSTLMNPMSPPVMRAAGYRAPEVNDSRKATQASDVYSYGVLILELLTGKSPMHPTGGEEVVNLVRWVNSVVREEWTAEVFDIALLRYPNIEEEMVEMLQIGMSCAVRMPEQRPKMADVVKMVENIRPANTLSSETLAESSTSTPTPEQATEAGPSSVPQ